MAAVKESMQASLQLFSKVRLRDGNAFPIFGLGTWLAEKDECKIAAVHAISLGYRLLDTASCYENEEEVGRAVRECGVARNELYVTGKLWTTDHGKDKAKLAFKQTMKKSVLLYIAKLMKLLLLLILQLRLGLDYLDLYLIHSPTGGKVIETWDALTELQRDGFIRYI